MTLIRFPRLLILVGVFATLGVCPAARASSTIQLSDVNPGDTFSAAIYGYDVIGNGNGPTPLTSPLTVSFGTTQTFTGAGPDGQNITVKSGSGSANGTTRAFVEFSAAGTFVNHVVYNGITVNQLQFDIGTPRSGGDTIDYSSPITLGGASPDVYYYYDARNGSGNYNDTLSNGNQSFAATLYTPSSDVFDVIFMFYYPTPAAVPESSSTAFIGLGVVGSWIGVRCLCRRRWS